MESRNRGNRIARADRSKAPPLNELKGVGRPNVVKRELKNGLALYLIPSRHTEAVRIDLLFKGGRPAEKKQMVSKAVGNLISRETETYSRSEISSLLDYKGAHLISRGETDAVLSSLLTTSRKAGDLIPLLFEVATKPAFPERELIKFIKQYKQKLAENLNTPSIMAFRRLTEDLFGNNHPYGYNSTPGKLDALRSEDLFMFHVERICPANTCILMSGGVEEDLVADVKRAFEKWEKDGSPGEVPQRIGRGPAGNVHLKRKDRSPQMSFHMGMKSPNRDESGYYELYILGMLLGGYFGSRLVRNIREQKGLAYDLGCSLDSFRYESIFTISGECNVREGERVLEEIHGEMRRLSEELIDWKELQMVKNYVTGVLMNTLDGPLNIAEMLKTLLAEDRDLGEVEKLSAALANADPEKLRKVARRHLQPESFHTVTVT